MIRFANFEPDRTKFALDASTSLVNAIPVADGWGPVAELVSFTQALPAACKGYCFTRDATGSYRIFAGTATGLYELNQTDYSWTDVSGLSAPYAVPAEDNWSFLQFGNTLFASNISDPHQTIDLTSGTDFADAAGSPPQAKYTWIAGEYMCLGHLATDAAAVMTSGIGDASFWTIGLRGCDIQSFADGGEIVGGIGSERGATVFQRSMIRSMLITAGGDYSFTTQVVNPSRGVLAPLSIAQIGPGQYFYYSGDGFFTGPEGRPIGAERVDRWFMGLADSSKLNEIRSIADPFNKIVWTQATDVTGAKFLVGYNWQLDRWCYAYNNITAMAPMVTPGVTWDGIETLFATWDDADIPWDSAVLSGGLLRFAAFDTDNKLGFFTGLPRAARFTTADIELNPGSRSFLQQARVYTDCSDFTLTAIASDKHGGTRTTGSQVAPYGATGLCHFRSSALLHAFQMDIPAGTDWNHVIGIEPVARAEGRR